MSTTIPEAELPRQLSPFEAVEAAYPAELCRCHEALLRGLPVLVECDKELTPYFYRCLRDRLRKDGLRALYLDGRPGPDTPPELRQVGLIGMMIAQLRDAVRGAVDQQRVVVLPHLDLLTTSSGALTGEAREVIPLLYENPTLLWLGFKDPSFLVPRVIENLFPHQVSIVGTPRHRLPHLVTQREARKLADKDAFDPFRLYKHVSGLNAVRLRRVLGALAGEDYPADARPVFDQLRATTLAGKLSVPEIDLEADIGGYAQVKRRLRREIIDLLERKDQLGDGEAIARVEGLVPRGMIFWGPPGTGKTLFAKAMATALGAAVSVVNGPELKSRWVGESEQRLRQIFVAARQSAPAVIVFDELDSFAVARGTYTGSGVEHSMVNQLLTEMDGFRDNELVFIVGTTNFVESLDPALLRPGRFEFSLCIPFPDAADRRAILEIYDAKLGLRLSDEALRHAVARTADLVEGTESRYSGDHLQALCRALARRRLREGWPADQATEVDDIEQALTEYLERPELTADEERIVALHEAGHAICGLHCEHVPPIERISIRGDLAGALGFVAYADPARRFVHTEAALRDRICVLLGGREAERLLLDDVSIGAAADLARATDVARDLVEHFGFGPAALGPRRFVESQGAPPLSDAARTQLEQGVAGLLVGEQQRARRLLEQHRDELLALRDLLLEHKVVDRTAIAGIAGPPAAGAKQARPPQSKSSGKRKGAGPKAKGKEPRRG